MRRPALTYFTLTFTVSWGGLLLVGAHGLLAGTDWQTDPTFLPAIQAMLLGPPMAGVVCTALFSGRAGLRVLLCRLVRWRVGARWLAFALLAAPAGQLAALMTLSAVSPAFLPAIFTAPDRGVLVASALAYGLAGGLVEELGWTGFAIPRMRERRGVLAVGLVMGVVWTLWHLLQMWWVGSTSSGGLPHWLFMPLYMLSALACLTAYRVLMVWVYDHTESLLVAVLMHASYIFTTLFVLAPPTTGVPFLVYSVLFAAILWCAAGLLIWARPHAP